MKTKSTENGNGQCAVQDLEIQLGNARVRSADARQLLADISAFVLDIGGDGSLPMERRLSMIRETIAHDVAGLLNDNVRCFVPRCDGWASRMESFERFDV